jgi:hypothetical protein
MSISNLDLYADIERSLRIPISRTIHASSTNQVQRYGEVQNYLSLHRDYTETYPDNVSNNDSKDSIKKLNRSSLKLKIRESDVLFDKKIHNSVEGKCFLSSSVSDIDKVNHKLFNIDDRKAPSKLPRNSGRNSSPKKSARNLSTSRTTQHEKRNLGHGDEWHPRLIHCNGSFHDKERDSQMQVMVKRSISQPRSLMKETMPGKEVTLSGRVLIPLPSVGKAESETYVYKVKNSPMKDHKNVLLHQRCDNKIIFPVEQNKPTSLKKGAGLSSLSAPGHDSLNRNTKERKKKLAVPSTVKLERPALTTRSWRIQISERLVQQCRKLRSNAIPELVICDPNFDNFISDELTTII